MWSAPSFMSDMGESSRSDRLARVTPRREVQPLASAPQRFEILPTHGFWATRAPRIWIASLAIPPLLCPVLISVGLPWYAAIPAALASGELSLGLFERWLRTKLIGGGRANPTPPELMSGGS